MYCQSWAYSEATSSTSRARQVSAVSCSMLVLTFTTDGSPHRSLGGHGQKRSQAIGCQRREYHYSIAECRQAEGGVGTNQGTGGLRFPSHLDANRISPRRPRQQTPQLNDSNTSVPTSPIRTVLRASSPKPRPGTMATPRMSYGASPARHTPSSSSRRRKRSCGSRWTSTTGRAWIWHKQSWARGSHRHLAARGANGILYLRARWWPSILLQGMRRTRLARRRSRA